MKIIKDYNKFDDIINRIKTRLDEPGIWMLMLGAALMLFCILGVISSEKRNKSFKYTISVKDELYDRTNNIEYKDGFIIYFDEYGIRRQKSNSIIRSINQNY